MWYTTSGMAWKMQGREGEKEEDRERRGGKESTFGTMILMTYIHIQIYTNTGVGCPLPPYNMDGHW